MVKKAGLLLEEFGGEQHELLVAPGVTETRLGWTFGFFVVQDLAVETMPTVGIVCVGAGQGRVEVRLFRYEPV